MDDEQIGQLRVQIEADDAAKFKVLSNSDAQAQEALQAAELQMRDMAIAIGMSSMPRLPRNDREAEVQASRIEHLDQLLQRLRRRQ